MKILASVIALAMASPLAAQTAPTVHTSHDQSVHALHPGQHGPGHADQKKAGNAHAQHHDAKHEMGGSCCKEAPGKMMECCEKMKAEGKKPCCEEKQAKAEAQEHKH